MVPTEGAVEEGGKVQVGFSVPKKKFRSSVDRHRVRRLLVEAWRHNKHNLVECVPVGQTMHVFLLFINPELPDYTAVETSVAAGVRKLCDIAKQNS